MAVMTVVDQELRVRFARWERLAVWRAEVVVPLAAVRDVELVDRPVARARGGRMGILVSGVLKVGVWGVGTGVRQVVSVRRGTPAVRVTIDRETGGRRFDELLISTKNAARSVELIRGQAATR